MGSSHKGMARIIVNKKHRDMKTYFCIAHRLVFLFACSLLIAACTKTVSLQGTKGDTGATGAAGATGAQGPAGSQIYSGNGDPLASLGLVGDYYIDEKTDSLYGPKTVNGWGTAISLSGGQGAQGAQGEQGDTGAAGTNGSTILSGTWIPGDTTGTIGDYYFDNKTDSLYGPKSNAGWGTAVSLRGAQGFTGPQGAKGDTGTANVIYYNWVGFDESNWTTYASGTIFRSYTIPIPPLTADILNTGVVLVYVQFQVPVATVAQNTFQAPGMFTNVESPKGFEDYLGLSMAAGQFTFTNQTAVYLAGDPGALYFNSTSSTGYAYRIIIIPGGVAATGIDPRQMSYGQVCDRLGIQP